MHAAASFIVKQISYPLVNTFHLIVCSPTSTYSMTYCMVSAVVFNSSYSKQWKWNYTVSWLCAPASLLPSVYSVSCSFLPENKSKQVSSEVNPILFIGPYSKERILKTVAIVCGSQSRAFLGTALKLQHRLQMEDRNALFLLSKRSYNTLSFCQAFCQFYYHLCKLWIWI